MNRNRKEMEMARAEDCPDLGQAYGGHGDVYRHLRRNHELVDEWLKKQKPSWGTVAAWIAGEGVVGARGNPPTERSAWKVWRRVCRDVQAEKERLAREEAERLGKQRELLTGVRTPPRSVLAPASARPRVVEKEGSVVARVKPRTGLDGQPESSLARSQRLVKEDLEASRNPVLKRFEAGGEDGLRD